MATNLNFIFFVFSLILNRCPSFGYNTFIDTCLSHKKINFGDIFSVLIIRFVKFIYHKVIIFILIGRLRIRLPHPF